MVMGRRVSVQEMADRYNIYHPGEVRRYGSGISEIMHATSMQTGLAVLNIDLREMLAVI